MSAVLYSLRDGKLRHEGREIELTTMQWRILTALLSERGGWVSRSDLIYRTWMEFDEEEPEWAENCIYLHVMWLRQRLEGTGIAIEAGYGRGFRARINGAPEPNWGEHPYNIVTERDGRRKVWAPRTGFRCGAYGRAEAR